mmetsp:Transcript_7339/g.23370  ORF Transcript_7339/g.23370 Transcript_7339/m.23370 type:complete len:270 (+) Transcript_7339:94-903(+)
MAMHPGLGKYPEMWAPTISRLGRREVPLVVCDTGDTAGSFYEFDASAEPEIEGGALHLPGSWRLVREDTRFVQAEKFPGGLGEPRFVEQAAAVLVDAGGRTATAHRVHSLWRTTYYAADARFLWKEGNFTGLPGSDSAAPAAPAAWTGPPPQEWSRVCSDSEGTLYASGQFGYAVGLLATNPFHYCELFPLCQSNRIVSVLEPLPIPRLALPTKDLFREFAQKASPCYSDELQPCLEERLRILERDPAARERASREHTVDSFLRPCMLP